MIHKLRTINGEGFESIVWYDDVANRGWFVADFDIDGDGGENVDHDPDWQPQTSLKHDGKPIDALAVPGVVLPGWLPAAVGPIVLGCRARVTNLANMAQANAVTHDTGPLSKVGEGTPALAKRLDIDPNARTGGESRPIVLYEFWPGTAAVIDGVTYQLQKS